MGFTSETGREAGQRSKRGKCSDTQEIREVLQNILVGNQDNIQNWLDETAKENPAKAIDLLLKMSAYVLPKPRHEVVQGATNVPILNIDPLNITEQ